MGLGAQPRLTIRELRERERARRVAETDETKAEKVEIAANDRLAAETTDERDARLECDRARHREQQTVQSSFLCFNSVPSKPRYVNVMQTGICYIGYTSMQAIVLVSKNHSSISYPSIL